MAIASANELQRVATAGDAEPRIDDGPDFGPDATRRWFASAYGEYVEDVYRYCLHRLGTTEAAEDATSEVFMKAFASLERYRRESSFRAWLFTIAHNTVIDIYRSRRVSEPIERAELVVDASASPEELAIAAASDDVVRSLLARLTPRSARVLELRIAGLSSQEISDVLGCSLDAVKQAQSRGYGQLRELITQGERGHVGR
jgi:RNA polymerase sigma-70 factor (ECF subfamily)